MVPDSAEHRRTPARSDNKANTMKHPVLLALPTLAALTGLALPAAADLHPRAAAQLLGGWSLASRVTTLADGTVKPAPGLAATPSGVLIYDSSGHVAAQLSRQGRTVAMLPEECRAAQTV